MKASVSNATFNRILSRLNVQSLKLDELLTTKRQKKLNALGVCNATAITLLSSAKSKKPRSRCFKNGQGLQNGEKGSGKFVVNLSSHNLTESEKHYSPKAYASAQILKVTIAASSLRTHDTQQMHETEVSLHKGRYIR